MSEKPPTAEELPDEVGSTASGFFSVSIDKPLGCGNFGAVFAGKSLADGKLVAIKFERSHNGAYAKREWKIMKALSGSATPKVYFTGEIDPVVPDEDEDEDEERTPGGKIHVMVMDRLGKSLQSLSDARPRHRLTLPELRVVGLECLALLRRVHEAGYVHGDVKPENFLVGHRKKFRASFTPPQAVDGDGAGAATKRRRTTDDDYEEVEPEEDEEEEEPVTRTTAEEYDTMDLASLVQRHGMYLVDLGLGLKWIRDRKAGFEYEVDESEDPTKPPHVPYKQRIDHFSGTVRYASVNVHLGRYSSRRDDLESLMYMLIFMYRGGLPWQGFTGNGKEMMVCRKKGSMSVKEICKGCPEEMAYYLQYVRDLRYKHEPDYEYLRACLSYDVGRFRLRRWQAKDSTGEMGSDEDVGMDMFPVATRKRRLTEARMMAVPEQYHEEFATLARKPDTKVVLPKTSSDQERQWILVSTSQHTFRQYATGGQTVTMHTSWKNLVKKIQEFWNSGKRITFMSFDHHMWSAVFDDDGTGYTHQSVHYQPGKEFPGDWVEQRWEEGYMITAIAANDGGWGVVASIIEPELNYTQQSYMAAQSFPTKWVAEKWDKGFRITSLACHKGSRPFWVVFMSMGTRFHEQAVEVDFKYPSDSIRARWRSHYMVTHVATSCDQVAFVLSTYDGSETERQHCVRTPNSPIKKVEEDWKEGLFVTGVAYGRVI